MIEDNVSRQEDDRCHCMKEADVCAFYFLTKDDSLVREADGCVTESQMADPTV